MANREYRQKTQKPRQGGWARKMVMLAVIFSCGYLAASYFSISALKVLIYQTMSSENSAGKSPVLTSVKKNTEKPTFEFYTLLTDEPQSAGKSKQRNRKTQSAIKQNRIQEDKKNLARVASAKASASKANGQHRFLVQIASFRNEKDAQKLKAEFILKGYTVKINPIKTQNARWFRVLVGPFDSKKIAVKAQTEIARSEHVKGMIRTVDV